MSQALATTEFARSRDALAIGLLQPTKAPMGVYTIADIARATIDNKDRVTVDVRLSISVSRAPETGAWRLEGHFPPGFGLAGLPRRQASLAAIDAGATVSIDQQKK